MRTKHLVCGSIAAALAFTPAAAAQNPNANNPPKPKANAVTLDANPALVVFSGATTLSGRISGDNAGGATVRLEQDATRPYGDSYKPVNVTATSDNGGKYTFALKPLVNTQYRAVAQTSPSVTSAAKLVLVRTLVGVKVSDATPARGALITFSGTVFPAHDGRPVMIQKRGASGAFVTVARTTLRDAGDARSAYSRRVRVFRDGVYRVKVSGDGDHINGFSRLKTINVAG